jgi:undecaprenyl-diphosphatase
MLPLWWIAVILGIIEGITEFLPISSTGHLIVAGHWLGFTGEFANTFEIAIQLGAIIAVVVYFRRPLGDLARGLRADPRSRTFLLGIGLAFLPAALIGLLTHGMIKTYLFTPTTVAMALILGGIIILIVEAYDVRGKIAQLSEVGLRTALWVGVAQCFSLFPGVSRSGATIIGGLLAGMDRKTATEFSFYLALPTMFTATLYDAYKNRALLVEENLWVLAVGFLTAFITALAVISFFLAFVRHHTFHVFGYYRIVFGIIVLLIFGV